MPSTTPEESSARVALDQSRRVSALWQQPLLSDRDAADAVGMPYSSWHAVKPRGFKLGRRVYHRTADLRTWLDSLAGTGNE